MGTFYCDLKRRETNVGNRCFSRHYWRNADREQEVTHMIILQAPPPVKRSSCGQLAQTQIYQPTERESV